MAIQTLDEQLHTLGITGDECRVYLSLLELGRGYVSVIAKRARVPRVNCYHLLDGLSRKGIVSSSIHKGKKMYQAEPPEALVKQQVERLRIAEKVLPELKRLRRAQPSSVSIRPIEGEVGIRNVFEETLQTAGESLGYTNLPSVERVMKDYLDYYAEERTRRRVRGRFLSPFTERSGSFLSTYYPRDLKKELNEIVFVDPAEFPFDGEVYIYGDNVATFSLNRNEIIGVVVESLPFAQTCRSIFNLSWLGATSFVTG